MEAAALHRGTIAQDLESLKTSQSRQQEIIASHVQIFNETLDFELVQANQTLREFTAAYSRLQTKAYMYLQQTTETLAMRRKALETSTEIQEQISDMLRVRAEVGELNIAGCRPEIATCVWAERKRVEGPNVSDGPQVTYRGSCHCGDFAFMIQCPEIKRYSLCNCRICYMTGFSILPCHVGDISMIRGSIGDLRRYIWEACHYFCPRCFTPVAILSSHCPGIVCINIGTLDGILDVWALEAEGNTAETRHDGYLYPRDLQVPDPRSPQATSWIYHGSCHCGGINVKLQAGHPIEQAASPVECTCAMCRRTNPVWMKLNAAQAQFLRDNNIADAWHSANLYCPAGLQSRTSWNCCNVCGVVVQKRAVLGPSETRHYVNIRVFMGINVDMLPTERHDGIAQPHRHICY